MTVARPAVISFTAMKYRSALPTKNTPCTYTSGWRLNSGCLRHTIRKAPSMTNVRLKRSTMTCGGSSPVPNRYLPMTPIVE